MPLTRIEALDPAPLDTALAALEGTAWVCFTSANAVRVVADRVAATSGGAPGWTMMSPLAVRLEAAGARVAAVGEATALVLEQLGVHVALVPAQHDADGLLAAFSATELCPGTRIFFPAAAGARDTLTAGLTARGAAVTEVPCYRSVADAEAEARLATLIGEGAADLITVTAPSVVRGVAAAVALPAARNKCVLLASIGPVTSRAAQVAGLTVACEADPHSSEGLVLAIERWCAMAVRP
ncbi:MAG: uroporphyrinogen-III synthase [Gemmatimonadetes bacterium]|nr:uroporphyrinogen-III synthase [Gemmatimonadota bacterium]